MILTPLFAKQNGEDVQLLARNEHTQYLINITGIQYYFYILWLPVLQESFLKDISKQIDKLNLTITTVALQDSEQFLFFEKVKFYKITGSLKSIKQILKKDTKRTVEYDNSLCTDAEKESLKHQEIISEIYDKYIEIYEKIKFEDLDPQQKIIYQMCKNPFRETKQSLQLIQSRYKLNFQDTLQFDNYEEKAGPTNAKYDYIINVDIKDIKQITPSQLQQSLQYYKYCMFDIENVVNQKVTFNKWHKVQLKPQSKMIKELVQKLGSIKGGNFVVKYTSLNTIYTLDKDFQDIQREDFDNVLDDTCADQNEIICISFVIANFNGDIQKRIALVRSPYQKGQYCDEVIQVDTEYDLLQKTMQILANKDINMIQHFNGWSFDLKQLIRRSILCDGDNDDDDFSLTISFIKSFNLDDVKDSAYSQSLSTNKTKKTFGVQDSNLFQITNQLRCDFDIYSICKTINSEINKLPAQNLNYLLKYFKLDCKLGISYQDITKRWASWVQAQTQTQEQEEQERDVQEEQQAQEQADSDGADSDGADSDD